MTVVNGFPDIEVVDDVENDYRPGGVDLHTDRGADQLEPGTGAAVPAMNIWFMPMAIVVVMAIALVLLRRRSEVVT